MELQASVPTVPEEETGAASLKSTTTQHSSCSESIGALCLSYTQEQ